MMMTLEQLILYCLITICITITFIICWLNVPWRYKRDALTYSLTSESIRQLKDCVKESIREESK